LKARLLAKLKEIGGTMSGIENDLAVTRSNDVGLTDWADKATSGHDTEEDYGLLEIESCVLSDINEALERIRKGTYGLCQRCMRPIPKRRLQAIAWARFCLSCAADKQSRNQEVDEEDRQRWAEEHAFRFQRLFEQWQEPFGIDSGGYYQYAKEEFLGHYNDPLRKSLVETI
jgi:RNA polymerase-binding transcription factor DksA